MRAPMAFFAGAGTVIAAIAVGLGGGLTVANIMNPYPQKQATLIDRRMSDDAARAANTQQAPVPHLEANLPVASATVTRASWDRIESQGIPKGGEA